MYKKSKIIMLSMALAMPLAFAQQSGGVQVRGNTELNVSAQNVTTLATGENNVARTNIGSIQQSQRGNQKITVDAKNVSNVVGGHGRKGCVTIGGTPSADCQ